jgi:hypothetical protein
LELEESTSQLPFMRIRGITFPPKGKKDLQETLEGLGIVVTTVNVPLRRNVDPATVEAVEARVDPENKVVIMEVAETAASVVVEMETVEDPKGETMVTPATAETEHPTLVETTGTAATEEAEAAVMATEAKAIRT